MTQAPLPFFLDAASLEDLPALAELERRSFSHPWAMRNFEEALQDPSRGMVLVFRTAHHRVGDVPRGLLAYCVLQVVLDEMHVHDLAVHPEHRRRGLGRRLLRLSLDIGGRRGAERALLEVRPSNGPAFLLYRSLGFGVVGVRRGYYRQPAEDALVMKKDVRSGPVP